MAASKRKSMLQSFCLAMGLFILAGVFRQLDRLSAPLAAAACFMLTNLIYIGVAMAWGFSISNRILHKNVRQYLLLGCAMAVMWMFLRTVKYRFFEDNHVTRYLWHLYYVPQILAPLFSLFAALEVGRREGDAISSKWYLLLIPATLLIGGVLTNDLHQTVFRATPGVATLEDDYTHGWLYYIVMAWIVGLLLAPGVVVYRKCRVFESRRYAWVPLGVFLGGFALCALSFAEYLYFSQNAGMLLPDVRGVLGKLPAGGADTDQRLLPLFLFRIHRRRADCEWAGASRLSREKRTQSLARSVGRCKARRDSADQRRAASKRADTGRARVLGGGYIPNQPHPGAACGNQRSACRKKTS